MQWNDSADNEYHLTPTGWIEGTEYIYGETDIIIKRPREAVETWVRRLQQASGHRPQRVEWERLWSSPEFSENQKIGIKRRYPSPA